MLAIEMGATPLQLAIILARVNAYSQTLGRYQMARLKDNDNTSWFDITIVHAP